MPNSNQYRYHTSFSNLFFKSLFQIYFLSRSPPPEFRFPSFASGSQKIGDFLGVALQVQQHEVLFASLKRTNLMFVISIRSRGLIFGGIFVI